MFVAAAFEGDQAAAYAAEHHGDLYRDAYKRTGMDHLNSIHNIASCVHCLASLCVTVAVTDATVAVGLYKALRWSHPATAQCFKALSIRNVLSLC